jgi:hypothetical protein
MFEFKRLCRVFPGSYLTLVAVLACAPLACFGQVTAGSISGLVKDETGAVLANAEIEVTNVETGIKRTTVSQPNGYFSMPGLPPGRYEARVSLPGFTTAVQNNISLSVGEQASVSFVLKVGATATTVEVVGNAAQVDTQSAALSAVVSQKAITELPLNGRNFLQLAVLQPGVNTFGGAGELTVNGQGYRSNSVLIDGSNLRSGLGSAATSAIGTTLGVETTAEFRIVTNSYSAEYGRVMGAVVSIVTKSGTNAFHGSAYDFFRDSVMDARNFFDRGSAPPFVQNQYGFSAGGPIRKDKLFFFAAFERLQSDLSQTQVTTTPNQAARSGSLGPVNPAVVPFLNLFPLATQSLATDPSGATGIGEYIYAFDETSRENYGQGRIDYQISDKDSLFGRYTIDNAVQLTPPLPSGFLPFADQNYSRFQLFTLEEKRVFSPTLLNTARFSFSILPNENLAFQFTTLPGNLSFVPGQPLFGALSVGGLTTLGRQSNLPSLNNGGYYTYSDDVSYTKGRNQFRMGVLIEHSRIDKTASSGIAGSYSFLNLAQFLAGNPNRFSATVFNSGPGRERPSLLTGLYIQDDVRATPRLTLNLGLRYEFFTVPADDQGRDWQIRNVYTDTTTTNGSPFQNPSLKNFAPRVGFAWDVKGDGSMSVRGGAGVYYDTDTTFFSAVGTTQKTPPLVSTITLNNPPFPQAPLVGGAGALNPMTLDYNIKQPRSVTYNLNVQRRLAGDFVATVGYAGSSGNHLASIYEANPDIPVALPDGSLFFPANTTRRNPAWSSLPYFTASGRSIYNALQASISKNFSKSYRIQASYTWSKTLDSGQGQLTGDAGSSSLPQNPYDRRADWGPANFDTRHVFASNMTWNLPAPNNVLLMGWQLNMIASLKTGNPFSVTIGPPSGANSNANWSRAGNNSGADRPNVNPGNTGNTILGGVNHYFDPAAFVLPLQGTLGNVGRNSFYGPGSIDFDLSLARNIHISRLGEAGAVQLRLEAFNAFNRANFGQPNPTVFAGVSQTEAPLPTAGQITSAGPARQIQLGVKILF